MYKWICRYRLDEKIQKKSKKWYLTGEGMHITDWLEMLGALSAGGDRLC